MSEAATTNADQANTLRSMAARTGPTVVALLGAKGGVGVSSTTLALTDALAAQRAAAIDAHWEQQDLDAVARLWWPGNALPVMPLRRLLIDAPAAPQDELADQLFEEIAQQRHAVVFVDAGAAATPWAAAIAPRADTAVLVATPDRLAALNAYAAAKRLRRAGVDPQILWNGCVDAAVSRSAQQRLDETCERAGAEPLRTAGWLPARDDAGGRKSVGVYRSAAAEVADRLHPAGRARRLERTTASAA